ncbi:hypothetical protein [Bradyrhizobium icense]|uniref:Uncharacterized protein n=1 Tax=Bradyrhizobium icense TaxID=1274631 RepID=A0A1B1UBX5_9BRAD|nr:hypothetical protein [Bradyrhizobium icense]ANW00268.1 hypothetical protein LMTR13_08890 [Bradyrhizobium icense]
MTVDIFGLPTVGKTTLAHTFQTELEKHGFQRRPARHARLESFVESHAGGSARQVVDLILPEVV